MCISSKLLQMSVVQGGGYDIYCAAAGWLDHSQSQCTLCWADGFILHVASYLTWLSALAGTIYGLVWVLHNTSSQPSWWISGCGIVLLSTRLCVWLQTTAVAFQWGQNTRTAVYLYFSEYQKTPGDQKLITVLQCWHLKPETKKNFMPTC